MAINTQSFTTIVNNAVAAIQGAAATLIDLTVGSILRATTEATALIALWLQGIALQIASLNRFATSSGADADSFGADFGFYRLEGVNASGSVTFARFTPTLQATIPIGTIVQTGDGTVKYQVIADTTQSAYNSGLEAYVIGASITSCTATIEALNAGIAGNVAAGLINTIAASIPYVDTVTNPAGFINGADEEDDANYKARFVLYLASLADGTIAAVINAVVSLQQGASCTVTENTAYAGGADLGYFYAIVDDGTGAPGSTFLATAYNAIDTVRPITISFGVFAPTVITANVAMTIATAAGYNHSTSAAVVTTALQTYINTLGLGNGLPFTRLAQIAYDAGAGVTNVTATTLNSGTSDLTATAKQTIKIGTCVVS